MVIFTTTLQQVLVCLLCVDADADGGEACGGPGSVQEGSSALSQLAGSVRTYT